MNINRNIFQIHLERKKKSQFVNTMEELKIYLFLAFKRNIKYLNIIFTELKELPVNKLEDAKETRVKGTYSKIKTVVSNFEEVT